MEQNTFTGETREPRGTPVAVEKELADIAEKKAGAFQKRAEGEKAQEETKQLREWNTAAGPVMLSLAAGVARALGMSAAEDMELKEWVEQMGQKMPTTLDTAKEGLNLLKAGAKLIP